MHGNFEITFKKKNERQNKNQHWRSAVKIVQICDEF